MDNSEQYEGICKICKSYTFRISWTKDDNGLHYRVYCQGCNRIHLKGGMLDPGLLDLWPVEKTLSIKLVD
jgi:hypothetical protein